MRGRPEGCSSCCRRCRRRLHSVLPTPRGFSAPQCTVPEPDRTATLLLVVSEWSSSRRGPALTMLGKGTGQQPVLQSAGAAFVAQAARLHPATCSMPHARRPVMCAVPCNYRATI